LPPSDLALGPAPAIKNKRVPAARGAALKKKQSVDLPPLPGSLAANSSIISEGSVGLEAGAAGAGAGAGGGEAGALAEDEEEEEEGEGEEFDDDKE